MQFCFWVGLGRVKTWLVFFLYDTHRDTTPKNKLILNKNSKQSKYVEQ